MTCETSGVYETCEARYLRGPGDLRDLPGLRGRPVVSNRRARRAGRGSGRPSGQPPGRSPRRVTSRPRGPTHRRHGRAAGPAAPPGGGRAGPAAPAGRRPAARRPGSPPRAHARTGPPSWGRCRRRPARRRTAAAPGPTSSASSTSRWGRSPASRPAIRPDSAATSSTKVATSASSHRGTETATVWWSRPASSTAARKPPDRIVTEPIRPDRARVLAARSSVSEYADSSTARTQALPHQRARPGGPPSRREPGMGEVVHASSRRRVTRSRRSSSLSSVSAVSPRARTASASARLRASSSAIRSSMVPCGDQAVHLHRPGLPDPVGAVGGLLLDGGVPPAVEVDDVVGPGQVQAGAAGLEARAGRPAPRRPGSGRTISSRSRTGVPPCRNWCGMPRRGEVALEQPRHRDVLGEDEHRAVLGEDRARAARRAGRASPSGPVSRAVGLPAGSAPGGCRSASAR